MLPDPQLCSPAHFASPMPAPSRTRAAEHIGGAVTTASVGGEPATLKRLTYLAVSALVARNLAGRIGEIGSCTQIVHDRTRGRRPDSNLHCTRTMHLRTTMSSAVWSHSAAQSARSFEIVRFGISLASGLILIAIAATSARGFTIERASVADDGSEAAASSSASAISADGRYVAFVSSASNLVADDTNAQLDVFVHDRATGDTERVSVSSSGAEALGQSATPALSADGRFVAFASPAPNLVAGDDNGRFDIFVRDRQTGTTERVSLTADGGQGDADSVSPAISADGRYVAFASAAALVPDDTNATFDIYVRDRTAATTTRVSVGAGGVQGNNLSLAPRISADGSVVVFHSFASNLVAGDTNNVPDVFAYDRASGVTARMSVSSTGVQATQQSVAAQVSGDGRYVAFDSDAANLVTGDTNGRTDVFVHDRVSGATERVSVASDGTQGNNRSGFLDAPALSADGRYVAFTSGANNLVPLDGNNVVDVMLRDRVAGTTIRVNVTPDGIEADGASTLSASMSADGSVVVFASSATNLVSNDANFVQDVFAYVDTCGNGNLDVGEQCDDGNRADGDCCSSVCTSIVAGTACDDGDLCTQSDSCDGSGSCVGANPVVCAPADGQCQTAPTCDPASGACVSDPAPAGSPCDDGDLCTQSDTCDGSGSCVGADPVVCASGSGQCAAAGACDPATGACTGGQSPDGTACDDGDPCTVQDSCMGGVCAPGALQPSACLSSFQCYDAFSWRKPIWWVSPNKVLLEDRFESARFNFGPTTEVCTAIQKPASQSANRLACVRLKRSTGGEKARTVQVVNALGTLTLSLGRAQQLCVPAGASTTPVDPGLDSFKCYDAEVKSRTPRFNPVSMTLGDEFGTGVVDVVAPESFCTPASVAQGGVEHERAQLVCYRIEEHRVWGRFQDFFRPRNVSVADVLGTDFVTLLARDHLCVPSAVVGD
jgi:cysteine-rich repeat protein